MTRTDRRGRRHPRSVTAARRVFAAGACVAMTATGCAFQGVNSLPLPGAAGSGSDAQVFHVELANAGTMESNSPVMIDDAVVGSVGQLTFRAWHANMELRVRPDVVVPANAVATVGQTSLLGSMHVELDPPLGQPPAGRLRPGATIALNKSSTYPSTEQTLSALSAVVYTGGLGQIGDAIHNASLALSGREHQVRDLLGRFDTLMRTVDGQRDDIIVASKGLNRLAGALAEQRDVLTRALRIMAPALDVLIKQRPQLTTALDKLRIFSDTATGLINDTQADLVQNLENLEPTICSLAEVGANLDQALAYATVYPYGQPMIDRGIRGDYFNMFIIADNTRSRWKLDVMQGTGYQSQNISMVPMPGDERYDDFMNTYPNGDGYNDMPRTPPPPDQCVPGKALMARAGQ